MPTPTQYAIIKLKRGTRADWSGSSILMQDGEIGFVTDSDPLEFKLGSGSAGTLWKDLPSRFASTFDKINFNGIEVSASNRVLTLNETNPGIPGWAKAASKPSYTAAEISGLDTYSGSKVYMPSSSVGNQITASYNVTTQNLVVTLANNRGVVLGSSTTPIPISGITSGSVSGGVLTLFLQSGSIDINLTDLVSGYVPTSRTIAGLPLTGNITTQSLYAPLNSYSNTVPISRSVYATTASADGAGKVIANTYVSKSEGLKAVESTSDDKFKYTRANGTTGSFTLKFATSSSVATTAGSAKTAQTASQLGQVYAGSEEQPVYFSNGVPVLATAYGSASVKYADSAGSAASATSASRAVSAATADSVGNADYAWVAGRLSYGSSAADTGSLLQPVYFHNGIPVPATAYAEVSVRQATSASCDIFGRTIHSTYAASVEPTGSQIVLRNPGGSSIGSPVTVPYASNADTVDGYHIVVGSTGSDPNTIYIV